MKAMSRMTAVAATPDATDPTAPEFHRARLTEASSGGKVFGLAEIVLWTRDRDRNLGFGTSSGGS